METGVFEFITFDTSWDAGNLIDEEENVKDFTSIRKYQPRGFVRSPLVWKYSRLRPRLTDSIFLHYLI